MVDLFLCFLLINYQFFEYFFREITVGSFAQNVEILADGGVIRITDLQPSNEGRFECNATNIGKKLRSKKEYDQFIQNNIGFWLRRVVTGEILYNVEFVKLHNSSVVTGSSTTQIKYFVFISF